MELGPDDSLVLYSDGLSEAAHPRLGEYGLDRLSALLGTRRAAAPRALIDACLADLEQFLDGARRTDDLTILAVCRRTRLVSQ
jgi:sigma-B regulation protein RsbU (phosphoserine phosphatase)